MLTRGGLQSSPKNGRMTPALHGRSASKQRQCLPYHQISRSRTYLRRCGVLLRYLQLSQQLLRCFFFLHCIALLCVRELKRAAGIKARSRDRGNQQGWSRMEAHSRSGSAQQGWRQPAGMKPSKRCFCVALRCLVSLLPLFRPASVAHQLNLSLQPQ